MKKKIVIIIIPGPLAPPCIRRPKRNITARSYSCTTYKNSNKINHQNKRK